MKRLKKYWDELHPEFYFLSEKNLRNQALRIEKNKVVMATEYKTVTVNIVENVTLNKDNCLENNNITNNKDPSIDQSFLSLNLSQEALLKILGPMFQCDYETINDQNIDERVYSTNYNKKLSNGQVKVIDCLPKNAVKELDNPKCFHINALLYMSGITTKESVNGLTELIKKYRKKSSPKWLNNIENKITVLRKKICQLSTLINCKTMGNFTNDQKEIKKKYDKKMVIRC